ncbi:MAG: MFS transporter [Candidatus Heimdallarchaeota archaeon]
MAENYKEPLDPNVFLQYNFISLLSAGAMMAAFTFVPIFLQENSVSDFKIGIVAIGFAIMAGLSSWLFGRASDLTGRREIFIELGLVASSLSFLLQLFGTSFELMLFARALFGFSSGIFPPALTAYAYEARGRMGKFSSFGALGWGIGSLGGGLLAELLNLEFVFFYGAILFAVAYIIAFFWLPERSRAKSTHGSVGQVLRENYVVYLAMLIRHSAAFAIWTFWSLFLLEIGAGLFEVGLIQFTNAFTQFVVMNLLTDRYESRKLIIAGLILSAIVFVLFATFPIFWIILLLQVLLGISWSALYVGALKSVTETSEDRSTAAGLLQSTQSMCALVGPIIGTILILIFETYTSTMVFAAFISTIAAAVFIVLSPRTSGAVSH